jgi:fibronectin type 3 domain-containing protein
MTARKTAIRFGVHANGVLEEITQNITGNEKRKSKHDTNYRNTSPVTNTTYLDSPVATGATYCYEVTAVLGGLESTPSNQAIAAVPPSPNRQAACEHRGPLIGWICCVAARPKRTESSPQIP